MTGLVRLVHTFLGSNHIPSRYLTLFYGLTLGLALVLASIAIFLHENAVPIKAMDKQVILSQTTTPTQKSTQILGNTTPTSRPAIPPTPNEKTLSFLSVTDVELSGVKVNLWHPWTEEKGIALQEVLDEFNRTNQWGISVQTSGYEDYGRLDEAMESALLANTQPDMIVDYGYQARHWDGVDAILDLTPYVNDPVWGLTNEEQADFLPPFWAEDLLINNSSGQTKRLGIPFYRSAYVLFYNQSWAHELGFPDTPITPEDFRTRACSAAQFVSEQGDKSNLGKGGWLITPQPGLLIGWIYAFGGEITSQEAPGYQFNTTETRQAFEYLKGLQNSGCAWSDTAADPLSEFANRNTLFIVGSLFDIPAQQEAFRQAGNTDEWVVLPFPSSNQPAVDTYGPALLITRSNPAKQLAAWLVLEWLVYPPNQAEWVKALGAYPTRLSSMSYLAEAPVNSPQWKQALELLPDANGEPSLASWIVMRWALEDVMTQLFDPQFEADQISLLLKKLDSVAKEIFSQVH